MNIKEFVQMCIDKNIPVDYEIKFAVGIALYDLDEYQISEFNRRIIFREGEKKL